MESNIDRKVLGQAILCTLTFAAIFALLCIFPTEGQVVLLVFCALVITVGLVVGFYSILKNRELNRKRDKK